jgi:endonuclease YncB( thermonuclease family)
VSRRLVAIHWAKEQLAKMVAGEAVAILFVDVDRYDRIVGRVYVGDLADC